MWVTYFLLVTFYTIHFALEIFVGIIDYVGATPSQYEQDLSF